MGSWIDLNNQPNFNASTMLLLTDGTVMCQSEGTRSWYRLTPDVNGSYLNGSWSTLADMANSRTYFASAVLADGRVVVSGGEYSDAGSDTNKGEIYDPLANSWSDIGNPGWAQVGDAAGCLLADGRLLIGSLSDSRTAIYDATTNTWSASGNMAARSNEETWTLLPDGSILTVSCANHPNAERYIPSTGRWISAGRTPVELVQASSIEIGPALLLPDGRVFCVGATGHTALYTPSGDTTGTGTWAAGPDFPTDSSGRLLKAKDAPGCLLPNGRVLCVAGPAADGADDWPTPTMFFEFDGTNLNRIADPPNANQVVYEGRMLLLPTGEVLYSSGTNHICLYQPDPGPQTSWLPVVTSCPADLHPGGTYTLIGQQLNGLSQAVSYGDDAQMATNYPIVRLRNSSTGGMYYCRTAWHSTMGVATGSQSVSTQFTVPASVPTASYQLSVVANGIASAEISVSVDPGNGRAQYLLVDRYSSGGATLWAYVDGEWLARSIGDDELAGVAQDLFAANPVDVWWDNFEIDITRGWRSFA
ncbi:Kelch motif-containing protein [Nakamurella panacisegetis]|uniref:Kelch motif-containing protein n=1 Tax=Nakamurella panacisegetis TaxID=1090615 RepID=A0A1H0HCW2_9ACTN|nr:kelch repeat-containing protein [Nakamurella panacisegetis]SDO16992.1 Kelch motif-containing protein [Nakamurella panacisegetis]